MTVSWLCHSCVMAVSWMCHEFVMNVSWEKSFGPQNIPYVQCSVCRVSTLTLRDIYLFSLERRQNKVLRWIVTFMLGGVRGLGTQQCSFDQLEFNKVTNQSKLSVIALNNFYRFGDLIHSLNDLIALCFLWLYWCGVVCCQVTAYMFVKARENLLSGLGC